jgi:predicted PurR-regulated permease PerM
VKTSLALTRSTLLWMAASLVLLVWRLPDVAVLIGFSVLLAYALFPIVTVLERVRLGRDRHLPRGVAAAALMLALVGLVGWLVSVAVPRLGDEVARLVSVAPGTLRELIDGLNGYTAAHGLGSWLGPSLENTRIDAPGLLKNLAGSIAGWAGQLFGGMGSLLGLTLAPLLAFYLLADSAAVQSSALRFVPADMRPEILRLGSAVDRALRSYVRGQALVCLASGAGVGILLALVRYPAALLLGFLAGIAQVIPYLGFTVTLVTVALVGLSVDPFHAALGVAIYVAADWATGTFITPRVMGRLLKMHPFVVTVSVVAGGRLLGPAGALLALPGAAMLQALIEGVANSEEVEREAAG